MKPLRGVDPEMSTLGVHLNFRDEPPRPDVCIRKSWPGFSVECVTIREPRPFDYDWQGDTHYLALHDIMLSDGEIAVDGAARAHIQDLRDRLTFVPQNARVGGWSQPVGERNSYAALFFDPNLAEAEYERPLLGLALRPLVYFEDEQLCRTLRRLANLVTGDNEVEPVAAETFALLAILQFYPLLGGCFEPSAGHLTPSQQRRLEDFVGERIASPISLSEMAALAGLSRYHFARSFTRSYGRAPHQYVLLRRIGLAASLLSQTNLPIGDIAIRVGFSSPARLSIAFRRVLGRSPRAFRQAVR